MYHTISFAFKFNHLIQNFTILKIGHISKRYLSKMKSQIDHIACEFFLPFLGLLALVSICDFTLVIYFLKITRTLLLQCDNNPIIWSQYHNIRSVNEGISMHGTDLCIIHWMKIFFTDLEAQLIKKNQTWVIKIYLKKH